MGTYSQQGADTDGRWRNSTGQASAATATTIALDQDYWSFLTRWVLPVPQGATITAATLTLTRSGSSASGLRHMAGVFAADVVDEFPSATTARWYEGDVSEDGSAEFQPQATTVIDVAPLLQTVVDRSGWVSGNAAALVVRRTTGSTATYHTTDASVPSNRPVLAVEWDDPVQAYTIAGVEATAQVGAATFEASLPLVGVEATAQVGTATSDAPQSFPVVGVQATTQLAVGTLTGSGDAPAFTLVGVEAAGQTAVPFASMSLPEPPAPEPWQRTIVNPLYLGALVAHQRTTDTRVEIIGENDAVLARLGGDDATRPGALSGQVTVDSTRAIRHMASLTVDNPDLLPTYWGDLLHPLAYNRLRIWWRIRLEGGTWAEIPLCTVYPDMPEHADAGDRLTFDIQASDAVALIKKAAWDTVLDVGGQPIHEAIGTILADRAPWVRTELTPTTDTVPDSYEPGEPGGDPWEDVESLAYAAGMVCYVDRMGTVRLEPRPQVGPAVAEFTEGEGAALLEVPSVVTDLDDLVNVVHVGSASPDVDPAVWGRWEDDDPASPLWTGRGHKSVYVTTNAIITTAEQATAMARNIGRDRAVTSDVQALVLPHPHLNPGDTVLLNRARANVAGPHTIVGWQMDITPGGQMVLDTTARRSFLSEEE